MSHGKLAGLARPLPPLILHTRSSMKVGGLATMNINTALSPPLVYTGMQQHMNIIYKLILAALINSEQMLLSIEL